MYTKSKKPRDKSQQGEGHLCVMFTLDGKPPYETFFDFTVKQALYSWLNYHGLKRSDLQSFPKGRIHVFHIGDPIQVLELDPAWNYLIVEPLTNINYAAQRARTLGIYFPTDD